MVDEFVSKKFPFILTKLTKRAAISKSIVERLADDLLDDERFEATSKSLEKAYSATYFK